MRKETPVLKKFAALGVLGASVLLAAVAGAAAVSSLAPREGVLPEGLRVAGQPLGAEDVEAAVARRAADMSERKIAFVVPKNGDKAERIVATATLAELGITVDAARTVRWARSTGSKGDFIERMEAARAASRGVLDVPLALRFDRARTMQLLDGIKQGEDLDPVSARLDLAKHAVVPERPGSYIDAHRAADMTFAIASTMARGEALPASGLRVELQSQSFPPRMTTDFVKSLDVSQVISSFETYFSRRGDQARRAKNIEVAAAKLDGLILAPGELMSFNQTVGDRSEENGFEKAWEIFKGEMKEGVGGGTCQVASTFHAAAMFAGIEILERLPHSRPSAYIPLGLDATVVYPVVDMKMRNPHSFPVAVHTSVEGNRVRFEILGPRKPGRVSFEREVLETLPYSRKVEEDAATPRDKVVVKQHGIRGFRIQRTRELTFEDGKKKVERTKDFYPPTLEIFKVHPSFDQSKLPPLPFESAPEDAATLASTALPASPYTSPALPFPVPTDPAAPGAPATSTPAAPEVPLVDAPGAHAPTAKQANPDKLLRIRR